MENPDCTRVLLQHGARITGTNEPSRGPLAGEWGTLLLRAIAVRRSAARVTAPLAAGADPFARTPACISTYRLALQAGLLDVADLLKDAGAAEPLSQREAFVAACARALLAHGLPAAEQDQAGRALASPGSKRLPRHPHRAAAVPIEASRYAGTPGMSQVRLLVGTRKGGFILTADGARDDWTVAGPFFAGWEVFHLKGSPVDPDRIYASQSSSWFGQVIQRSDDGGGTWQAVDNQFRYDGIPGTHQWYDGTPHPWEFKRVWHIEPSLDSPDRLYAGVEDAALFQSSDGGHSWQELSGLRQHGTGSAWQPGAGGMCLHSILLDPSNPRRMFIAISAAGVFRTDDGGQTWSPINRGLHSGHIPNPTAEVGHCVHHLAMHPSRPGTLFMQKHWDVMRTDDAGESWHEISGNLPTDFGFVIDVHAHEPETIYVVPIKSDAEHFPLDGQLRVYRSRGGGNDWEPLTKGLPQSNCYVNVLRDAMAVDTLDPCGVYFGTTGGQVYGSPDAGDSWTAIVHDLPAVLSLEVQTLP